MSNSLFPLSSLTDVSGFVNTMPMADKTAIEAAQARQNSLTKPPGSLGRLEGIAIDLAGWKQTANPVIENAQALVFAGNHGVCAQGVNPFPQEVTVQMVANFEAGGAAINQLCAAASAELSVIALDLENPTADISQDAAMSEAEALDAMNKGAASVDEKTDILLLGEMGIGNSTIAAALAAAVFGGGVAQWVGAGTGSDAEGIALKTRVIEAALALHAPYLSDGMAILSCLGGREQAAICGAVLAARQRRIPVLLDGYICTAAVAPLWKVAPQLLDHCLVGHQSAEPGHRLMLQKMRKSPILDFDMRLGEGSGAALALGVVRAALACHNGMATFGEAGVSEA